MARPKGVPNKRKKAKVPGVTFGTLIRSLRIREGMSQTSFAKRLDLHPSYISRLEAGMRRPSPEVLKQMSVLLRCPHERLIQVSGMVAENLLSEIRRGPVGTLSGEVLQLRSRLKPKKESSDILISGDVKPLPVYDSVPAGVSVEKIAKAAKGGSKVEFVDSSIVKDDEAFAMVVSGNSMKDAGIMHGDIVVISPNSNIKNGDIALVAIGQKDVSLKRVYIEGDYALLHAANSDFPPVMLPYPDGVELLGKAVWVRRKM
jgi:SOS-response transcriptional repressor LexA